MVDARERLLRQIPEVVKQKKRFRDVFGERVAGQIEQEERKFTGTVSGGGRSSGGGRTSDRAREDSERIKREAAAEVERQIKVQEEARRSEEKRQREEQQTKQERETRIRSEAETRTGSRLLGLRRGFAGELLEAETPQERFDALGRFREGRREAIISGRAEKLEAGIITSANVPLLVDIPLVGQRELTFVFGRGESPLLTTAVEQGTLGDLLSPSLPPGFTPAKPTKGIKRDDERVTKVPREFQEDVTRKVLVKKRPTGAEIQPFDPLESAFPKPTRRELGVERGFFSGLREDVGRTTRGFFNLERAEDIGKPLGIFVGRETGGGIITQKIPTGTIISQPPAPEGLIQIPTTRERFTQREQLSEQAILAGGAGTPRQFIEQDILKDVAASGQQQLGIETKKIQEEVDIGITTRKEAQERLESKREDIEIQSEINLRRRLSEDERLRAKGKFEGSVGRFRRGEEL